MEESQARTKRFTVAIVGGGIGGLTLAIGLLRRNVPVQIYEAASAFGEIGLGLSIGPAAHRAMRLIDPQVREIYDSLITTHADSPGYERFRQTWFEIIWATGENADNFLTELTALPSGQTTVRRCDFLDGLVKLIPPEHAHFGRRLVKLEETVNGVHLTFQDGTSTVSDVVIGCDGIHSKVKESLFPDEIERVKPQYSGMYGYRAVIDMETMVEAVGDRRARISTWYIGKGAYAITYPIMRARKVNVGLYTLNDKWDSDVWVRPAKKEDMQKDFGHMGTFVNSIMKVGEKFCIYYAVTWNMLNFCFFPLSTCTIPHNGRFLSIPRYRHLQNPRLLFLVTLPMPRLPIRELVLAKQ